MVCFRLKNGCNEENQKLNEAINLRRKIYVTPTTLSGKFTLRMAICSRFASNDSSARGFMEVCDTLASLERRKEQ